MRDDLEELVFIDETDDLTDDQLDYLEEEQEVIKEIWREYGTNSL
jgi:hypothetical protein